MITATIQGISDKNNQQHITAFNGEIIDGDITQEKINQLYKDCYEVSLNDKELYCELKNGKLFCAIEHPVLDDIGRIRTALIVWDKDTPRETIRKTLGVMGLSYPRLLELEREYNIPKPQPVQSNTNANTNPNKNNLYLAIGAIIMVAIAIILLIK